MRGTKFNCVCVCVYKDLRLKLVQLRLDDKEDAELDDFEAYVMAKKCTMIKVQETIVMHEEREA